MIEHWEVFVSAGVNLVPIVDVPTYAGSTEVCMEASNGELVGASTCSTPRGEALLSVPGRYGATGDYFGLDVVDLTDVFCGANECPAVIGNTIVYRDLASHITATFSRSLAIPLYEQVAKAISSQGEVPLVPGN